MDEFSEAPVVSEDIELDGSSNRNVVSFELEGIMVDFPFQPYDLQKEYMARILRIMKNGGNALLESPTGTHTIGAKSGFRIHPLIHRLFITPNIGTGKTLCLLCATLAYRRHTASIAAESALTAEAFDAPSAASTVAIHPQALNRIHSRAAGGAKDSAPRQRIIYAARTHAQLAQVVKELRATGYRAVVRVLGSRQHLCLNTQVQELPSGQQQYACRSLVSKKKCSFMRRLDDMESRWAQELDSRIHDLEDIVEAGKRNQACPYYMSRIEIKHADVVIVPYNYVFDPGMRKVVGLDELMKGTLAS
jgi:regulator of telomere elongation helicase 1